MHKCFIETCEEDAKHAAYSHKMGMMYFCAVHFDVVIGLIKDWFAVGKYSAKAIAKFKKNNPGLLG